ncbi:hypothetical protein SAMN05421789_104106 [Kaistella chaponensis]|uniref:Uncharacterized protein n=1 Tax=Kaistella chaponensis TaxID=713588 RepID=A0A1N7L0F7_9FLAO|nr:hypothetical protein SAMN05421789_104106 [Kaistella chaponensis]
MDGKLCGQEEMIIFVWICNELSEYKFILSLIETLHSLKFDFYEIIFTIIIALHRECNILPKYGMGEIFAKRDRNDRCVF